MSGKGARVSKCKRPFWPERAKSKGIGNRVPKLNCGSLLMPINADELDLQKRMARIVEGDRALLELGRLIGPETTSEPKPTSASAVRARAISEREEERDTQRELVQGEEEYRLGDYAKALEHFGAESFPSRRPALPNASRMTFGFCCCQPAGWGARQ